MRGIGAVGGTTAGASGLRPGSAVVLIAGVLLVVAARSVAMTLFTDLQGGPSAQEKVGAVPSFELHDRFGRLLAGSQTDFTLSISPNSMWRSHTPERMARRVAQLLERGGSTRQGNQLVAQLLERFMPDAHDGVIHPVQPKVLVFDAQQAAAVERWCQTGSTGQEGGLAAIEGFELTPLGEGRWTLAWEPLVVLSARSREQQFGEQVSPVRWTNRILDDLAQLVGERRLEQVLGGELEGQTRFGRQARVRKAIWSELMPSRHKVVWRGIEPPLAYELRDMFSAEQVSPWQALQEPRVVRRYPTRPQGWQPDRLADPRDAFAGLIGHWGSLGSTAALEHARDLRDQEPWSLDWEAVEDPLLLLQLELLGEPRPVAGLELLVGDLLRQPPWSNLLDLTRERYSWERRSAPSDRSSAWPGRTPGSFQEFRSSAPDIHVTSTIDAELQSFVHEELLRTLSENDAALAQATVVDVQSGEILAVDGVSAYPTSQWAPAQWPFTPGSTLKPMIMAVALDEGAVRPDEELPTYAADGGITVEGRHIEEARGWREWPDHFTAAMGLAKSVNAVLVQVGLRVADLVMHEKLIQIGYGQPPGLGLGLEKSGYVPTPPWSSKYTHVSICFGHEMMVTLLQHAAAFATLARGGEYRPLIAVKSVEQGGRVWPMPAGEAHRALGTIACEQVMEMMGLGALVGTGRELSRDYNKDGAFDRLFTKTGTFQRVPTELCPHVEFEAYGQAAAEGRGLTKAERRGMKKTHCRCPGRRCYTSSICVVAHWGPVGHRREVLVIVVVDGPRTKYLEHFGSKVAGPPAGEILRHMLGAERASSAAPSPVRLAGAPGAKTPGEPSAGVRALNNEEEPWSAR